MVPLRRPRGRGGDRDGSQPRSVEDVWIIQAGACIPSPRTSVPAPSTGPPRTAAAVAAAAVVAAAAAFAAAAAAAVCASPGTLLPEQAPPRDKAASSPSAA